MKTKPSHFLNGKFVEEKDLVVSVNDLGFSRGYAVFDFLVTYSGRAFMLEAHIDRLFKSAELINLLIPHSKNDVKDLVLETFSRNKNEHEKTIKIIVSGGVSDFLVPEGKSTFVIICKDRKPSPSKWYEKGVGVSAVEHTRYNPMAKTNNYIEAIKQIQKEENKEIFEPVYYDKTQVFEGSNSNLFAVIDGKLKTPKTNVLEGITRKVIINSLDLKPAILIEDFTIEELERAEEVFITGSNKEVLPVTKIDGKNVGSGKVGSVTKEVMEKFQEFTKLV